MNRNNGAQSSCVLLTMIISGCQHCWLWGFKIFPVPTQTSLPFPSFPRANRPQAALHYREACPSVFSERLSQIFTTWCVHTGLQHLPCHVLLAWTWIKTGVWLHRGTLCTWRQSLWRKIFTQHREGQSFPAGLGISTAVESSSSLTPIAHLAITFLWANPAPGLLFPAHSVSCSLNFCIWKKPKSQLKSQSTLAASAVLLV